MGILNHLFGGRKTIAKELKMDAEKRMKLWQEHLENYKKREELAKKFWPKNINVMLNNPAATNDVLEQIENTINKEFFELRLEKEKDSEILRDLEIFSSKSHLDMVYKLSKEAVEAVNKQQAVMTIFRRIHDVLQLEMNTIKRIRKDKKLEKMYDMRNLHDMQSYEDLRNMLLYLSKIIINNEGYLYLPLKEDSYRDVSRFKEVNKVVKAVILGQKIEEKILSAEDKFVRAMVKIIGAEDSRHHLREAAVEIYQELLQEAGAPFSSDEDYEEGVKRMDKIVDDDGWLGKLIKRELPKYSEEKVKQVMKAFRISFKEGHLEGAADLYT